VTAVADPPMTVAPFGGLAMIDSERLEEGTREWQNDLVRSTLADVTVVPLVTTVVAMGRAADVLPRYARQADLLVLAPPGVGPGPSSGDAARC